MNALAQLDLVCERRAARSVLTRVYTVGLARASRLPPHEGEARVQLASLGPGLLDGDRWHTAGRVGPGATLVARTQMATPVFASAEAARAETRWTIADGGMLVAVGQPLLPAAGSAASLRWELDVAGDGIAILTDTLVLAPGAALRSTTLARIDETLVLRDVLALPAAAAAEGALGTVYAVARDPALRDRWRASADEALDAQPNVRSGVGGTNGAVVIRLRGGPYAVQEAAEHLATTLQAAAR